MVHTCCVPGCGGNTKYKPKVSVFRFPRDESLRREWVRAVCRPNFSPRFNSRVCIRHFKEEDIRRYSEYYDEKTGRHLKVPLQRITLKKHALPLMLPGRRIESAEQVPSVPKPEIEDQFSTFIDPYRCAVKMENDDELGEYETEHLEDAFEAEDHDVKDILRADDVNESDTAEHTLEEYINKYRSKCFPCKECGSIFLYKSSLANHMTFHATSHEEKKDFKCDICCEAFSTEVKLWKHETDHEDRRKKSEVDSKKSDNDSALGPRDRGAEAFRCDACGQNSGSKSRLLLHVVYFHDGAEPARPTCDECLKPFKRKRGLRHHLAALVDYDRVNGATAACEKIQCAKCRKTFRNKCKFIKHICVRSWKCHKCKTAFDRLDNLRRHLRARCGEGVFDCDECDETFASNVVLSRHLKLHNAVRIEKVN